MLHARLLFDELLWWDTVDTTQQLSSSYFTLITDCFKYCIATHCENGDILLNIYGETFGCALN